MEEFPAIRTKVSRHRRPRSLKRGSRKRVTRLAASAFVPQGLSISLVKIKEAARTEFGLLPAPPENLIASCVDYGLQKYSSDSWIAIEFVRIVQELPDVPAWAKILTGLFGVGAGLQGVVDIRDGLAGRARPQTMAKFTVPEFQLPRGFAFPRPA
jgi:hypothetical protein